MKNHDVFVIDDDVDNKADILRALSKKQSRNDILTFGDGEEALLHLDQKEKGLDQVLIFLDMGTSAFNGWRFLDKLQSRNYRHKANVLIMSDSPALDKRKLNGYPQVMGFLNKQLAPEIIFEVIDFFNNILVIPCLGRKADAGFPYIRN